MKNIIVLSLLMTFCLACSDDFLDRYPLDEVAPETFFKTDNDLKLFANRFYTTLPVHSGYSMGNFGADGNSDNMLPTTFNTRLAGLVQVPTSGGGWSWGNIRQANYLLANTAEVPDGPMKNLYIGEVRFFRAWMYFQMVKRFGNLPWIDKPTNIDSEELQAPRLGRNVIVDKILEDLDYAITNLKWKSESESNRLNKETAYAFKSRVALFEGTWEKYHAGTVFGVSGKDGSDYLQLAADAAETLIDAGKCELFNTGDTEKDYHNVFNQVDLSKVSEAILWKKYDKEQGVSHNLSNYIPLLSNDLGLTESLVDSYLCTDGKDVDNSSLYAGDGNYADFAKNRDSRLSQTVLNIGDVVQIKSSGEEVKFEYPALNGQGGSRNTTGYQLYKGTNLDPQQRGTYDGEIAAIIFRYAEVLLNFAEAKAELGTLSAADLNKSINKLRQRVGMPDMDLTVEASNTKAFPSLSNTINSVRRERRVELACEGRRLDDLLRWNVIGDLLVGKKLKGFKYKGSDLEGVIPDITVGSNLILDADGYISPYENSLPAGFAFKVTRDYLMPLPTEELVLNPNLKPNNPGWEDN